MASPPSADATVQLYHTPPTSGLARSGAWPVQTTYHARHYYLDRQDITLLYVYMAISLIDITSSCTSMRAIYATYMAMLHNRTQHHSMSQFNHYQQYHAAAGHRCKRITTMSPSIIRHRRFIQKIITHRHTLFITIQTR